MSWFDDICNAISKFFAEVFEYEFVHCFPAAPDTEGNKWSWDNQEEIGEWNRDLFEETGADFETIKHILENMPEDFTNT